MLDAGEYRGQSGRSLHARMLEHTAGVRSKKMSCPLYRHRLEHHQGDDSDPSFTMKKTASSRTNMERLIQESEFIGDGDEEGAKLWNSKTEYGKSKLIRWAPTMSYV